MDKTLAVLARAAKQGDVAAAMAAADRIEETGGDVHDVLTWRTLAAWLPQAPRSDYPLCAVWVRLPLPGELPPAWMVVHRTARVADCRLWYGRMFMQAWRLPGGRLADPAAWAARLRRWATQLWVGRVAASEMAEAEQRRRWPPWRLPVLPLLTPASACPSAGAPR